MKKTIKKITPKLVGFHLNSLFSFQPENAVKRAFYLFCSPRNGKITPEQQVYLDSALREKITVNNSEIQTYRWKGNNKTVLLVHGWESNAHRWKSLIEKLQAKNYNIISLDAPAHGNSSGYKFVVPEYAAVLEKLIKEYHPEVMIGHSVGGMTVLYQQAKQPIKDIKIVSLGAPSELTEIMNDYQRLLGLKPKLMKALENYFKERFGYNFHEFSSAIFVKNIEEKGLIIHDKLDKIVPVNNAELIHKNWKNAELMLTEGAGHSLYNDAINEKIIQFIEN